MSWQDDVMADQALADALENMEESEWRDLYNDLNDDEDENEEEDGELWESITENGS